MARPVGPSGTEADVVIVGGGGSGLAAAIEATRAGASVILLEKGPVLGGTTARAVGSISTNGSPQQKKIGINDTPQEHFEDLGLLAGEKAPFDNLALRRLYTTRISETFQWLMDCGLEFHGPSPEAPHRYPRMHTVLPNAGAYIYRLGKIARSEGVAIRVDTKVEDILADAYGSVCGVRANTSSGPMTFTARRGVVLTSGDYSSSYEMKAVYMPEARARVPGVNPLSTGDGQRMAQKLGAEVLNGQFVFGPELRFVPPPRRLLAQWLPGWHIVGKLSHFAMRTLPKAIVNALMMKFLTTQVSPSGRFFQEGAVLVNRAGRRFTRETDSPAEAVACQPEGEAFLVFDRRIAEKFNQWPYFVSTAPGIAYAYLRDYERDRQDVFHRASSVDALARAAGLDAAGLDATLQALNAQRNAGQQGEFDEAPMPALSEGPFYALGPIRSCIAMTEGGLKVGEMMEVIGAGGKPIPGLYAAGSAGQGGLLLEGHGHHLGWAFVSGRIAGRSAAVLVDRAPTEE